MCVCACTACAPSSVRPCERASVAAGYVSGQLHPLRLARGPGDALALLRTHLHPSAPLTLCVFAPSPPTPPTCCASLRPMYPAASSTDDARGGARGTDHQQQGATRARPGVCQRAPTPLHLPGSAPARSPARYRSSAQTRHPSTPLLHAAPPHPSSSSSPPHPLLLSTRPTSWPRAWARLAYAATTAPRAAARSAPCSAWARTQSSCGERVRASRSERRGGGDMGAGARAGARPAPAPEPELELKPEAAAWSLGPEA